MSEDAPTPKQQAEARLSAFERIINPKDKKYFPKVEFWGKKKRKVLVLRDKGRMITWASLVGKTKRQEDAIRERIQTRGSTNTNVLFREQFKNSEVIYTQEDTIKRGVKQLILIATIQSGNKKARIVGYSKKVDLNKKQSALNHIFAQAIDSGIISYTDVEDENYTIRDEEIYYKYYIKK